MLRPRPLNDLLKPGRRHRQVLSSGVVPRDCVNRMTRIQRSSGLNDRRRRLIAGPAPFGAIELWARDQGERLLKCATQFTWGSSPWRTNSVGMRWRPCGIADWCSRRDEDREDRCVVAGLVEVLQI